MMTATRPTYHRYTQQMLEPSQEWTLYAAQSFIDFQILRQACRACRTCRNCGISHGSQDESSSLDCLMISIRVKGEILKTPPQDSTQPDTVLLPTSHDQRVAIGSKIWTAFQKMKTENEGLRRAIKNSDGVRLKRIAPIPWLRWNGIDGTHGQFRSKQNFEVWWAQNVVDHTMGLELLTVQFEWDSFDL